MPHNSSIMIASTTPRSPSPRRKPLYEGRRVHQRDYLALPDDGFLYDMIDGVLHVSPSPLFHHGTVAGRLFARLDEYLHKNPVGRVTLETDVFLPDEGDVLRPDLTFVLSENDAIIRGHIHGVPDLVCEILSDRTRHRDVHQKADRYLNNGVREYWLVDPQAGLDPNGPSFEIWINSARRTGATEAEPARRWRKLRGSQVNSVLLPGFNPAVDRLFD